MALLSIPRVIYCNYILSAKAKFRVKSVIFSITPIASKKKSTNESIEHQSKPDYRDVVIQNSPECKEAAVQTNSEATAAEITGKLQLCSVTYS